MNLDCYLVLNMFVDSSTRETRVSSVDSHPVWKYLSCLPPAGHQDDLTAGPGYARLEALNSQPRVVLPAASACPNLPGELKTEF